MQILSDPKAKNVLEDVLNGLGLVYKDFADILIKHDAIMSGSFILQVIQNKFYSNTDIDIYVFGNEINEELQSDIAVLFNNAVLKHNLAPNISKKGSTFKNYIINKTSEVANIDNSDWYGHITPLKYVNEIGGLNTDVEKIQICYIDPDYCKDYSTFLIEHYDFDFCANYWDGKEIWVKDLESIKTMSCVYPVQNLKLKCREISRLCKYLDRGFDIKIKLNDQHFKVMTDMDVVEYKEDIEIPDCENLILIYRFVNYDNGIYSFNLDNLPLQLKNLVIYSNSYRLKMSSNLPFGLEKIHIYEHWHIKTKLNTKYKYSKLPFGCEVFLNDEKI